MDLKTFNPNGVGVDNGAYYGLSLIHISEPTRH